PQANPSAGAEFLRAETFRLRIRFASLFSGRLVIKEISLAQPQVVWTQNADGKWRIPMAEQSRTQPPPAPVAPRELPSVAASVAPPAPPASEQADAARPFTPEVRRVNLADGTFRFLDAKGKPVASFEGVNFRSSFRNATALRGDASIAKTSLRDRFFLEQLETPLKYDPTELELSQITARAGDGEVTGRFSMRPGDMNSPFEVLVKFHDVQADKIVRDAGGPEGMIRGRLEGHLDATGNTADPNALAGTGEIHLHDGQVRQYSLLVALGQVLQIDELKQLRFEDAHVKYHIQPGVITVDELLLRSANIRLSAAGTVSFSGKLRLDSQLAISDSIRGQLFRPIRDNFEPADQDGYSAVAFKVTGTVERPKTDLMDKLVGSELKDLQGLISGFLGGDKPERPKKKKAQNDAKAASAAAIPEAAQTPAAAAPAEEPTAGPAPDSASDAEAAPEPTASP
ncbi:MAG TPA: AsmA-like C-terminal region-containing protein, partial [Chthoniobacterales bacterium]|nr:AsmA-like C-terminal region-containing protein [Chthoniobacterales bacterium]